MKKNHLIDIIPCLSVPSSKLHFTIYSGEPTIYRYRISRYCVFTYKFLQGRFRSQRSTRKRNEQWLRQIPCRASGRGRQFAECRREFCHAEPDAAPSPHQKGRPGSNVCNLIVWQIVRITTLIFFLVYFDGFTKKYILISFFFVTKLSTI